MDDEAILLARAFRQLAEVQLQKGNDEAAAKALDKADQILGLTKPQGYVDSSREMSGNQEAIRRDEIRVKRNKAIAVAKATTPLHMAAAERFGSLRQWSLRNGWPVSSVSAYAIGVSSAPVAVDRQARRDFPEVFKGDPANDVDPWEWPKGVRR